MTQFIITSKEDLENLIDHSIRKALKDSQQNQSQEQDKIFTIKEASDFLNLAKQTLYGFTSKRVIPFIKRGKKLYFRKSDLESWINEGKRKSISEIEKDLKGGKL